MTCFGNESVADFKHLTMTQQFYTQIHAFHGAVVLELIIQSFPNLGERNLRHRQAETAFKFWAWFQISAADPKTTLRRDVTNGELALKFRLIAGGSTLNPVG